MFTLVSLLYSYLFRYWYQDIMHHVKFIEYSVCSYVLTNQYHSVISWKDQYSAKYYNSSQNVFNRKTCYIYRLLNSYSVLGWVLWSEFDHRACEVINPTKERGPKHCMSSITELLYTSIKFSISVNKSFCVAFLIIIKGLSTNSFLNIRHSVHLHARVVILKLQSGLYWIYAWRHNHAINERAINRRAINDYYGTIASHDEVWQFYRGI